jgi:hypothetical protein
VCKLMEVLVPLDGAVHLHIKLMGDTDLCYVATNT